MAGPTTSDSELDVDAVLCELGPLGIEVDGVRNDVRGERTATLLASLSLAGAAGVDIESLIDTIWPAPDRPATARQSLANVVHRLRATYGASFIESTAAGYRLGTHVRSDRERFVTGVDEAAEVVDDEPERALHVLDDAMERWRDDPWTGIERPIGVEADRARLLRTRSRAVRVRATALIALGRHDSGLPDLRELLDEDPYDEMTRRHLVQILADQGRRTEALRLIQEAHRLFAQRGLLIDAALVDIERGLLSEEFASAAPRAPLPEPDHDFVGRRREVEEISELLRSHRLVTIHGPGGAGKTRLAVEVGTSSDDDVHGFVDLVSARTAAQVTLAFAHGLGVPVNRLDGLDADQRRQLLSDAARRAGGLLVVDNCEHVVDAVSDLLDGLLGRPGRLRVLATSRVPLGTPREHRYTLPHFADGAALFVRHAARHGITIDPDPRSGVVDRICEMVDHLPLAIEIAAARTPYRTLEEIADELAAGVVQHDAAQTDARHETMSAAIRWSHDLLDPVVGNAFVRLGVFDGPFERDDAEAVMGTFDTTIIVDTLVAASLLERGADRGRSTYRLPVPIQQYCADELERRDETSATLLAFAEWMLDFTDRPYGEVWWDLSVIAEINTRFTHALAAIGALRDVGRIDEATRLASRLGGARLHGHAGELVELLLDLRPQCENEFDTADAVLATLLCADWSRHPAFGPSIGLLGSIEGPAGRRHRVFSHCMHALVLMMAARLTDEDYASCREELERATALLDAHSSKIEHALVAEWWVALALLEGDWGTAEAEALRVLHLSTDTNVIRYSAVLSLCHARLQLGDPATAFDLASRHAKSGLTVMGNRLDITTAIALVQLGQIDRGLDAFQSLQRRFDESPWDAQHDDLAIGIAYAAHLLGHDDLARELIDTGVLGFGPWIGHLVPAMCRRMGIPNPATDSRDLALLRGNSELLASLSGSVLRRLRDERHID